MRKTSTALLCVGILFNSALQAGKIQVVAAENFYGNVAETLGKPYVSVTSILNNPDQDPHLFESTPKIAIAVDEADIVIENGAGYDAWMDHLIEGSSKHAIVMNVAKINGVKMGLNPHIWYGPHTMPTFANAYVSELSLLDPMHAAIYQKNLQNFERQGQVFEAKCQALADKIKGQTVSATEPVFNDLARALGLTILNQKFAWNQMNGASLSPDLMIAFEQSLNDHKTDLLIYNNQVTSPTTEQLRTLAIKDHVPVVGVSELMPAGQQYYQWMEATLQDVAHALGVK